MKLCYNKDGGSLQSNDGKCYDQTIPQFNFNEVIDMLMYLRQLFTFVKLIFLKFSDGAKNKSREVAA